MDNGSVSDEGVLPRPGTPELTSNLLNWPNHLAKHSHAESEGPPNHLSDTRCSASPAFVWRSCLLKHAGPSTRSFNGTRARCHHLSSFYLVFYPVGSDVVDLGHSASLGALPPRPTNTEPILTEAAGEWSSRAEMARIKGLIYSRGRTFHSSLLVLDGTAEENRN